MSRKPSQRQSHFAPIREFVQNAIDSGTLPVGQKLPTERELAARFGVARSAVRTALAPLELSGVIRREVGRGTYVLRITAKGSATDEDIDASPSELIEAALSCYPYMCEVAAANATRADLRAICECADKVRTARSNDDYRVHDAEFHMAIARATQNRVMVGLAAVIDRAQSRMHWGDLELVEGDPRDHELIYQALLKRNGELARVRMEAHLAGARVVAARVDEE